MLFTSHQFLFVFLPIVALFLYVAHRFASKVTAIYAMTAASLVFYYFNGLAQLPVLVLSILVNHSLILAWMRAPSPAVKAMIIGIAISANLAVLGFFKYSTFAEQQYELLTSVIPYHLPAHDWWTNIEYYLKVYPWGYSGIFLRVCPETSVRITEFSEHEPD